MSGKLTVGTLVLIGLGACSTARDYEAPVKALLRDPESAQFSDVAIGPESVCGFVNSRNGYGGYAGRQPFIVVGNEATLLEARTETSALVNGRCQEPARAKINAWLTDVAIEALKQ